MSDTLTTILLAVIGSGVLTAIITNLLTRRKMRAEIRHLDGQAEVLDAVEAETFADAIQKLTSNNSVLQVDNRKLYQDNVALEKAVTETQRACDSLSRSRQQMAERLTEREDQIVTLSNQLRLLQDRERQSEITNALTTQMQAVTEIRLSYEKILEDRDQTIKQLVSRTGPLPALPEREARKKADP